MKAREGTQLRDRRGKKTSVKDKRDEGTHLTGRRCGEYNIVEAI